MAWIIILYVFFAAAGCKARETFRDQAPTITPAIGRMMKQIDSGPVQGGTIALPVTAVNALNPYQTTDRYVNYMNCLVFESLFVQTGEDRVKPWLVSGWESSEHTIWNFSLYEGVNFHNGSTLSAYDVKYSLELLQNSSNPYHSKEICENILQVNVINSYQLEITLKMADPSFTSKLSFPILSRWTEDYDGTSLAGTGPYQYDSMTEKQITLKRFDNWWTKKPANLEAVVFKVYPEAEMLDAFQNNDIDAAFVRNVDFTKYQHRTDINYQVFPDNQGNFIYVNPNGLFGQANRQDALFRYITSRLYDMNLGQVQYYDEYSESPLDVDGFRQAMVQTGLSWNEAQKLFTWRGSPLGTISIIVPKQDIQKLHTANFLVNILQDAGIKAQIHQSANASEVNRLIRNGGYDLSPVTEEIKPWENLDDTLQRMQAELGYGKENSYILPLYRNQQAMLYNNNIRGEKNAFFWNPYQGIASWYLPIFVESSLDGT
ncbi:MAG: ABC transporter substrate-binding protein [Thermoclostridium sp.]|nr:ABC transporter substrate-binding protein [Thermoclostridium sp.]